MTYGEQYLDDILEELRRGRRQWRRGDKLLDAFGYTRRRQSAIDLITEELRFRGMTTIPALSTAMPLDRAIRFVLVNEPVERAPEEDELEVPADQLMERVQVADPGQPGDNQQISQPTVSILAEPPVAETGTSGDRLLIVGNLEAAERLPIQIKPTDTISAAMTVMDLHDFSQLPVTTGPRDIKGIISFKLIARGQLHRTCSQVSDCLDQSVPVVERHESLLRVIDLLREHDAVLVLGNDRALAGIVTSADIALEFGNLAGPFLLIGQIEDQLRWLVSRRLDVRVALERSGSVFPERSPNAEDLTMGNLQRILEHSDNWDMVGIAYDRESFCAELNVVRGIRNAVMHFREPPVGDPFERLKKFASVVQRTYVASSAS